jgi:hypothetical protein
MALNYLQASQWLECRSQCIHADTMAGEYRVAEGAVNCIFLIIGDLTPAGVIRSIDGH